MAALSFSPSPAKKSSVNGKENTYNSNAGSGTGSGSGSGANAGAGSNSNSGDRINSSRRSTVTPLGAKSFSQITVHNVLSESGANALQQHINNQNTIIRKIKDFGMLGAAAAAAASTNATTTTTTVQGSTKAINRKRSLNKFQNDDENTPKLSQSKRIKPSKKIAKQQQQLEQQLEHHLEQQLEQRQQLELVQRAAGTPGRKGLPLPQAVARRNARERNRVKQVNNGFAALRERIPDEVSEAFEAQGAGRGASKKLSKVETLRMAVEYIRSLEKLLGFDFPPLGCSNSNSSSSGDDSFMYIKDEFEFDDDLSNYDLDEPLPPQPQQQQKPEELDSEQQQQLLLLPPVTTLNGLQYVRIAGTSTYQLLTPDMLPDGQDEENHLNALIDTNCPTAPATGNATTATTTPIADAAAAAAPSNGECVKFSSHLSRSPVPTTATSRSTSPATAAAAVTTTTATATRGSSSMHQPPGDAAAAAAVTPVAVAIANELLLQACAAQQQQQQQQQHNQQQQQQLIKQEYSEGDFVHVNRNNRNNNNNNNNSNSPPASNNYQQQQLEQQQQLDQQQQQLLCPALLPPFYDPETISIYDNIVSGLPASFKKEYADISMQDPSTSTHNVSVCLSDESMIDAIDWWEAHTPTSDGSTVAGI